MKDDALYFGRVSNILICTAEFIGILVGALLHKSLLTACVCIAAAILLGINMAISTKDKEEGKYFPQFMTVGAAVFTLLLGYAYDAVLLTVVAAMVNGTVVFTFQRKRLCFLFAGSIALLLIVCSILQYPGFSVCLTVGQTVAVVAAEVLTQLILASVANLMDFSKRKAAEQETSLDDLLKIVEAKRIEAKTYSAELEKYKQTLEERVKLQTEVIRQKTSQMMELQQNAIEGMATLIESRDGNTGEHVRNTRKYVSLIVKYMAENKLWDEIVDDDFVYDMILAAPLHDVGKIEISDIILNKPGKFTPEEFEIMKSHAALGSGVVKRVLGDDSDRRLLTIAMDVARCHHEKYNGSGYPAGLSGEGIPLSARIMAVADVFDALVSERVYKKSMSIDEAYGILEKDSGVHFDPEVVEIFKKLRPQVEEYLEGMASARKN